MRTSVVLVRCSLVAVALQLIVSSAAVAQAEPASARRSFTAESWCADSGTACWRDGRGWKGFNGVRLIADLDLGYIFQRGGNRFEGGLRGIPKIALEVNLIGGWVAFQTALMAPGTVTFDDRSDAVKGLLDSSKGRQVRYDYGLSFAASFLDGSLSLGYGWLRYDRRDFRPYAELVGLFPDSTGKGNERKPMAPPRVKSSLFRDGFLYASLQPISGIRSSIKNGKEAAVP